MNASTLEKRKKNSMKKSKLRSSGFPERNLSMKGMS